MNILLVGAGGREHALAWKLSQSPQCGKLYCAPGNAGIADTAECIDIAAEDIAGLVEFAIAQNIKLVVIGPEAPLVAGLADRLRENGIAVFGPSQAAARLEGSKAFMKDLCAKYGIPTAAYGRFTDYEAAAAFIRRHDAPIVVKTDGLAAGKGVIIAQSIDEALSAARDMLSGRSFGDAGREIIIEEFLEGEEVSFFALADGKTVLPLISAQDHKRVGEGDTGLNTGGMGAFCPAHIMNDTLQAQIVTDILEPLVDGMARENCPFTGVIFAGLMIRDGKARLLEYNVRFGDPECQAIMALFDSDLAGLLLACAEGRLEQAAASVRWRKGAALCVVMAARGYPGSYVKNTVIGNLAKAATGPDQWIFHAGTARDESGRIISTGGRVLGITAFAPSVREAQAGAYAVIDRIDWPEGFCRRDIGWRAIAAEDGNDGKSVGKGAVAG